MLITTFLLLNSVSSNELCVFMKWGDNLPNAIGLDSREAIFLTLKCIERRDVHLFMDKVLG
jgi:hypothetical protein